MPLPPHTAALLLPPGYAGPILSLARQWTRSWLLTPAVYVDPSSVIPGAGDDGPLSIPSHVVARDDVSELDLFSALSRYDAAVLNLVAIRVVTRKAPDSSRAEGELLEAIREALERSRPRSRQVVAVNLLIAPTGRGGIAEPGELILNNWANVVASPEDRESLDGFDRFTRESDPNRFVGFILSHAAAAAGLWAGSPGAPYDDEARTPGGVTMQRTTLRAVFADRMLADVANAAAERLTESTLMSDRLVAARVEKIKPLPPDAVQTATERLVENTLALDGGALSYAPIEQPEVSGRRKLSFGKQLAEFTRFAWDALASVPTSIAESLARRAGKRVTDVLHGPSGEAEAVLERWVPQLSRQTGEESRDLEARQARARVALDRPLPRTREDLNPRLWAAMRQLSFACLDGSQMPEGIKPLGETTPDVEVFRDSNSLVPDWRDRWVPSRSGIDDAEDRFDLKEPAPSWNDDDAIERWRARLAAATTVASRRVQAKDASAAALRREVEELEANLLRADESAIQRTDEAEALRAEFEDLREATAGLQGPRAARLDDSTDNAHAQAAVTVAPRHALTEPPTDADKSTEEIA